jgi:hypothetical protein
VASNREIRLVRRFFGMVIDSVVREVTAQVLREKGSGSLAVASFYLDDGVVAGEAAAVAGWLELMEVQLGENGLELCRRKWSVSPACRGDVAKSKDLFQDMKCRGSGDFTLLGAAFGSPELCTAHLSKMAAKADRIMEQLGKLENAHSDVVAALRGFLQSYM